jgi:CBS domain containing-hemolysin-like protein
MTNITFQDSSIRFSSGRRFGRARRILFAALAALAVPFRAHASLLHGETLDSAANVLAWVVLVIAPVVGIGVFWIVHILPEKIAEKRKHPQAQAIQTLCLLSLIFGGLLWPIAWLWAYTKPVLHKLAYGTDVDESHGETKTAETAGDEEELKRLRERTTELEARLASKSSSDKGKA